MKTKKAIFDWWVERGIEVENINDLEDFRNKIDIQLSIQSHENIITTHKLLEIKIMSQRWKYPLYLTFTSNNECIRICGF